MPPLSTSSALRSALFSRCASVFAALPTLRFGLGGVALALPGLLALAALILLPVASIVLQWFTLQPADWALLRGLAGTVLTDYALTSLLLCVGVGAGVLLLGVGAALAVALFDFAGRRVWAWALLLPLAVPAYVVAYAYSDWLQFAGPVQSGLRRLFNAQGAVLPDMRSTWGAALVLTLTLYPYVYLLARTALVERSGVLLEAAQLLGAGLLRRIARVALPLARPAIAAGVALCLMETLADFGVSSYYGVHSFSAGIYKAWLALDNRALAAALATLLLLGVALLLKLERRARARADQDTARHRTLSAKPLPLQRIPLRGWRSALACGLCALPVALGFVLPLCILLWQLLQGLRFDIALPWSSYARAAWHSVSLAGFAALFITALALALLVAQRFSGAGSAPALASKRGRVVPKLLRGVQHLLSMGYALPGVVVVIGILLPVLWINQNPLLSGAPLLAALAALPTATAFGLIWAYSLRFSGVALQSLAAGYGRIPRNVDEQAQLLGTPARRVFARLHLPLLSRSAWAAGLLVFVDVMKELPATLVLRPFNTETLAVLTYQLARDERLAEAAVPALAMIAVGLLPIVWMNKLSQARV